MVVVAAAGMMLLSACGSESSAGGSLTGRSFLSISVTEDGKPKQLAPNTRIGLRFKDGNVHAETGCNQLGGEVSTDDGKLTVGELGGTEMGCDPARHAQEDWVGQLLRDRPTWKLEADKLTLTRGGTELVLQDRETAQPDKPLDGTKWSLETVIAGQTASHSVGSEKAHLTIAGERVTGSTGCNEFQGIVAKTAGKLTFGELSTTRKACTGDDAKLEQTVLGALKGELTYTIEADRLKLRAPDGNGLDLTAR
ncbi:META domain-containing protein [Kribbella catacumbae]|uniref:META domain-containing protein n=1 Tax=Kribbella catacumbae TaxID=460086 RepID=UPI00037FFBF9|nr:META domain-containing protein [Kribbella catacumbae]